MKVKTILNLCIFIFVFYNLLVAQDDYQKWLQKEKKDYNQFLEEDDRAFSDFLKKEWKSFQSNQGIKEDTNPKPTVMPVAEDKDKPAPPPPEEIKPIKRVNIPEKAPELKPKPEPVVKRTTNIMSVKFFGADIPVNYKPDIVFNLKSPLNNEVISSAWEVMAASKFKVLLEQLETYKMRQSLNDWGYLQLVNTFGKKLFPESKNEQNLFTWFIMNKSGYEAKVAYKENEVFLLVPNENLIYENRFVTLDGKKYYFISFDQPVLIEGQILTYNGTYKGADRLVSMAVSKIPILNNQTTSKTLKFNYNNEEITLNLQFDEDVVEYFKQYPQTELKVYFDAAVSDQAKYSLAKALKPYLQNKTELDAVNFLLRFVQTAFTYETDDKQFGREKYLMLEETLFYPGSDCEDRSILFSYLVRELLGLDVIGLDYPGHISTAVKFNSQLNGDSLNYNNQTYIICDPTYVNADAGMAMPRYKNVEPVVIML